jgi:cullin-4
LACGKYRVLVKTPRGKEVTAGDRFSLNEAFNDRLYRIRISQVQMRETAEEHRQTVSLYYINYYKIKIIYKYFNLKKRKIQRNIFFGI